MFSSSRIFYKFSHKGKCFFAKINIFVSTLIPNKLAQNIDTDNKFSPAM